jgi:hypothetical protein
MVPYLVVLDILEGDCVEPVDFGAERGREMKEDASTIQPCGRLATLKQYLEKRIPHCIMRRVESYYVRCQIQHSLTELIRCHDSS